MFVLPAGAHTIIGTTDTRDHDAAPIRSARRRRRRVSARRRRTPRSPTRNSRVPMWWPPGPGSGRSIALGTHADDRGQRVPRARDRRRAVGRVHGHGREAHHVSRDGGGSGRRRRRGARPPGDARSDGHAPRSRGRAPATRDRRTRRGGARARRAARRRPWPIARADLVYAVQCEHACTLSDLLMRRTHVAFETRDAGVAARRARLRSSPEHWVGTTRPAAPRSTPTPRDARRVFAIGGRDDG